MQITWLLLSQAVSALFQHLCWNIFLFLLCHIKHQNAVKVK